MIVGLESKEARDTNKYFQKIEAINDKVQVRASLPISKDLLNIGGKIVSGRLIKLFNQQVINYSTIFCRAGNMALYPSSFGCKPSEKRPSFKAPF